MILVAKENSVELATSSVVETRELAAALAELAQPGDVLLLVGELGAGKTAFAQGFGQGLGVAEPITSPTFALASCYRGRLELNHLDVYRLTQLDEVTELGLYDLLDGKAVLLVEWGDAIEPVLPADFLEVRISFVPDSGDPSASSPPGSRAAAETPEVRRLELRPVGPRWSERMHTIREALRRWGGLG